MLKTCVGAGLTLSLLAVLPSWAHHGHDHGPPQPPTAPVAPVIPVIEPPPPVVQPPALITFTLPVLAPPSVALPTDTTGFHVNECLNQLNKPASLSKEELAALLAKDNRFEFTGQWIPFSSEYSATAISYSEDSVYRPVGFTSGKVQQFGRIEHTETKKNSSEPEFMSTVGASYSKVDDSHLDLTNGAVLVRAGDRPVFVSTKLCDEHVTTRISGGSIALVSAFDGKPTILNITDKNHRSVFVTLPAEGKHKASSLYLRAGEIAEAYKLDSKPTSNLVATKVEINERIGEHCGLLVSQCHYVRAMRKFNLMAALPKQDFEKVLKTAAAISHVRRGRSL